MSTPAPDPVARVRAIFDTVADDYDQSGVPFFAPAAQGLVDALDPQPGERGLDIGCGRGAVTSLLARAVLPSGRLDAVDLSPAMVEHTRSLMAAEGLAVADARGVDGAVNGVADVTRASSGWLRRIQTGVVQSYAFAIVVGVALVLALFILL